MNTDKTLNDKFSHNIDSKPIWYYKKLKKVDISYVIFNLLKESFVVEIDGSKHEITFGKNRKHKIGQCIQYDDVKNSNLCSYQVINKGFANGTWFIITDKDTSDEFKKDYDTNKEKIIKEKSFEFMKQLFKNMIKKDISEEEKLKAEAFIENSSYEELDKIVKDLFSKK